MNTLKILNPKQTRAIHGLKNFGKNNSIAQ
jgi:hypothetical protein